VFLERQSEKRMESESEMRKKERAQKRSERIKNLKAGGQT
jgi:hypothetical protein